MSDSGRIAREVQKSFGLPDLHFAGPMPFGGMDTQASRLAIADNAGFWIENLVKLGDGKLRCVPDRAVAPLYTQTGGRTIICHQAFTIGLTDYFIVFFTDGSAVQVRYPDGAVTVISAAASHLFYTPAGSFPATVGWDSLYLLIANNNTRNDYWAWDGAVLYRAGGLGPQVDITAAGTNYIGTPTVIVFGGSGGGAVLVPTIVNGAVVDLVVTNPGIGYVPGDNVQAVFAGGGSDTGARLEAVLDTSSLNAVIVLDGGAGYSSPPTVVFTGGDGTGAAGTAVMSGGSVASVTLTNPGSGYTSAPAISFTGGGTPTGPAQAQATLVPVGVDFVRILDGGSNYTGIPVLTFKGGFGRGAAATPILAGPGPITSIKVLNGGTGYTSLPTVTITDNGSGATGTPTITAGAITSVAVGAGGSGYTAPPRVYISGDGFGAVVEAVITGDAVTSFNVLGGGTGYTTATLVVLGGTGSGAEAEITGAANGSITAVALTNDGGTGYSDPQVSLSGGGGTGASVAAYVGFGTIIAIQMDHAGSGYTTAPAVFVQEGLNAAASATLSLMPFGVSGASLETYQSQVWLQYPFQTSTKPTGGVRQSSAPSSITDFSTSGGGLTETNTDRFLRRRYSAIRQSNGFLYPFGDSSVGVISNVQVAGSPSTKTLNSQNTDPQIGTNWRDTIQDFSRTILFANPLGVWGLFGGAVTKISSPMDDVFYNAAFPTSTYPLAAPGDPVYPSSAVANIFNNKAYLLLMSVRDPFTGTHSNKLLAWIDRGGKNQEWFIISQGGNNPLTYIATQEIDTNVRAWGTDGNSLFQLLATPSDTLEKTFSSKLYGADKPYLVKMIRAIYVQAENFADQSRAPVFVITIDTEFARFSGVTPTVAFPYGTLPTTAGAPVVNAPILKAEPREDVVGVEYGITLRSSDPDFQIINLVLATEDKAPLFT